MSFDMRTLETDIQHWIDRFFPDTPGSVREGISRQLHTEMGRLTPHLAVNTDKTSPSEPDCVLRIPDSGNKGKDWFFILNRSIAHLSILYINPVTPQNGLDPADLVRAGTLLSDEQEVQKIRSQGGSHVHGPYRTHSVDKNFIDRLVKQDAWNVHDRFVAPALSALGVDDAAIEDCRYNETHPLNAADDALRDLIKYHRRIQIRTGIRSFMQQLDPRALAIMRRGHVFEERLYPVATYEWLTGYHEEKKDRSHTRYYDRGPIVSADAITRRQDLGERYPGLLNMFRSLAWHHWDTQNLLDQGGIDDITAVRLALCAKDGGDNLTTDEQCKAAFPDDFIRGLRAKGRLFFDGYIVDPNPFQNFCEHAFRLAASLPAPARPTNGKEWAAYNNTYYAMRVFAGITSRPIVDISREFARLVARPNGIPPSLFTLKGTTPPARMASFGDDHYSFDNGRSHFMDFVKQLGVKIIIPAIARTARARGYGLPDKLESWTDCSPARDDIAGRMVACLYRDRSLEQMFNQAVRWHDGQGLNVATSTGKLGGAYTWPALTLPLTVGDVRFETLHSTAAIVAKAEEYKNCVHGYTRTCVIGHENVFSHILELTHADGSRALMELHEKAGPAGIPTLTIGQIEKPVPEHIAAGGEGRPTADPWAWEAADALLARFNDPAQNDIDWRKIQRGRSATQNAIHQSDLESRQRDLEAAAGFDVYDRDAAENAYGILRARMPKFFEAKTLDDYLRISGMQAALDAEFPTPWMRAKRFLRGLENPETP